MFPAGTYYVGDLCYVMHDKWDKFCDATIKNDTCLDGQFIIDGVMVASYGTKYGDGQYLDQEGRNYPVDAGLIGCIRVDEISPDEIHNVQSGQLITFTKPFKTGSDEDGTIWFGEVRIQTGDTEEEEDDYWEEEDDYSEDYEEDKEDC